MMGMELSATLYIAGSSSLGLILYQDAWFFCHSPVKQGTLGHMKGGMDTEGSWELQSDSRGVQDTVNDKRSNKTWREFLGLHL